MNQETPGFFRQNQFTKHKKTVKIQCKTIEHETKCLCSGDSRSPLNKCSRQSDGTVELFVGTAGTEPVIHCAQRAQNRLDTYRVYVELS